MRKACSPNTTDCAVPHNRSVFLLQVRDVSTLVEVEQWMERHIATGMVKENG